MQQRKMKEKRILELLKKRGRPLSFREIGKELGTSGEGKEDIRKTLGELERKGILFRTENQKYFVASWIGFVTGKFILHPDGYGFVEPDVKEWGEKDIFIPRPYISDALPGDRVIVAVTTIRKDRAEGKIFRILERGLKKIVGLLVLERRLYWVIPQDRRLPFQVLIRSRKREKMPVDHMVVCEIARYPEGGLPPEGIIVRDLGSPDDPAVHPLIIEEKYELSPSFPPEVIEEAENVREKIPYYQKKKRVDLRKKWFITIDGESAKDFDDAVYLEELGDGNYRLFVAIADVSYYVKEGSLLDKEAFNRATSVYFPDRVYPMFPLRLSTGICSLNPDEDRPVMVVEMILDPRGVVKNYKIYEGIIRSHLRMTYEKLAMILVDEDKNLMEEYRDFLPLFYRMKEIAEVLRQRRMVLGSLDFDLPEPEFIFDREGRIEKIQKMDRNIAHSIIEEFMLLANKSVARFVADSNYPMLYRCHAPPDPQKLETLREFLRIWGLTIPDRVKPKHLQKILFRVEGTPQENLINTVILRSMMHAEYSPENYGHFALAFKFYTHFTSPIRRYPDLVVHRILKDIISGKSGAVRIKKWKKRLPEIAKHSTEREKIAEKAEREIIDYKKVEFMMNKVGDEYEGIVSGVSGVGFWVELKDYFVEGFVPLYSLTDDFYRFSPKTYSVVGVRHGRIFQIGDNVKVKVVNVDLFTRQIELNVVDIKPPSKRKKKKKKRKNKTNTKNRDKNSRNEKHKGNSGRNRG